ADILRDTVEELESQSDASYRLTDRTGAVLWQSAPEERFFAGMAAEIGADKLVWRVADHAGRHYLQIAGALTGTDGETVCLEAVHDVQQIYRERSDLSRSFCWMLLVALLVGAAAAWTLSERLTDSLTALTGTARAITAGDLEQRVHVTSTDEIGQLAADFNEMTDRLCETIEALERENAKREEFMAAFAHEMRTPMTSIIGYADLLRSQELRADARAEAANYIFAESRRLENLSNKLLDLIVLEKQEIARKPCHMGRLIAQTGGLLDRTLRQADISLRCRVDETVWPVEPDLFKTLLLNLLDNARKAMPEGGVIVLRAAAEGNGWKMTVRDTGQGIPADELPRLTEAFYRVDKARARASGGVGLGLRLCAEIVRIHGGMLTFESAEGAGTTVTVLLKGGDGADA
ncbi:MAG: HAMP domain-containing histidine kinase, partial [Butyricicoccus sp.]|nr:HAMP domain-containing histidine kinase [Butyricicoccus sp.]